jgi:hypothetical protein
MVLKSGMKWPFGYVRLAAERRVFEDKILSVPSKRSTARESLDHDLAEVAPSG